MGNAAGASTTSICFRKIRPRGTGEISKPLGTSRPMSILAQSIRVQAAFRRIYQQPVAPVNLDGNLIG